MFGEIEPYKQYLSSVRQWTEFVKEHPELNLPTVSALIYHFGSWSEAKAHFGYIKPVTIRHLESLPENEVKALLEPYKQHLSTALLWDAYVNEYPDLKLPNFHALIEYFGSWNSMKQVMGLPVHPSNRPTVYTKDDIIQVVKKYAPHSFSPRKWEKFRKEQKEKLPSFQTISKNLSKDDRDALQREFENKKLND
ncbi:hypothetical protein ACP3VS_22915 [Lysinibacillus sp. VIII_CA]|uniref:hypothetical protein n=1 Tax=Lysinibacillus TaxID=400634 RepID=UPI0004D8759D|nr:hypothetical protein [Lysinibacillus sphaericus]KEK10197.1 hypothetical protein EP18_18660 [Lysinibacillus sphaericus]KEK11120.1 hypothetical protein EP18_14190 [Lysinibacillus sphaericus]MBG9692520.1 hypothetical protein [Lysinibacillus sphaericus]